MAAESEEHHATHATHAALVVRQVARGVKPCGGIEHVVMVYGQGDDRHVDCLVNEIGLRRRIGGLSVYKFRAADDHVLGHLPCRGQGFRILRGDGAVERTLDYTAFLRGRRIDGQAGIETCGRENACLGGVVVVVFLESARRAGFGFGGVAGGGLSSHSPIPAFSWTAAAWTWSIRRQERGAGMSRHAAGSVMRPASPSPIASNHKSLNLKSEPTFNLQSNSYEIR